MTTIKLRRDIAANWLLVNPILAEGEVGLEVDSQKFKVGDGVTAWSALAYWLAGSGGISFAVFCDQKASGVDGGTFSPGWQTRDLNTVLVNTIPNCGLGTNQVNVGPGDFLAYAVAPAYVVHRHKLRIRNISDNETLVLGVSTFAATNNYVSNNAVAVGYFSLAAAKTIEVQHRGQLLRANDGFGTGTGSGENEVYAILQLWKV